MGADTARGKVLDEAIVEELRGIHMPAGNLFVELASQFLEQMPVGMEELETAAHRGDLERLRRLAHKLLGTCRQLGAQRLAGACADLQSADTATERTDIDLKVITLHQEFEVTRSKLQDLIAGSTRAGSQVG